MSEKAIICDRYGFFNGIYGVEQTNWANYWKGVIPDGVVANSGGNNAHKEMEVYLTGGLGVGIGPGECMVDNHRAWITGVGKGLTLNPSDPDDPRIDAIIIRAIYGNEGESIMELDIKEGTPSSTPYAPELDQITGQTYEYALATIYVPAGAVNLTASDLTDQRYVYSMGASAISTFAETRTTDTETQAPVRYCELSVADGREYRLYNGTGVTNTITNTFDIILPENPVSTFMCAVDFSTGAEEVDEVEFEFQGVEFYIGNNLTPYDIKTSNMVTVIDARYNLLIWWDGEFYWCDCKAV